MSNRPRRGGRLCMKLWVCMCPFRWTRVSELIHTLLVPIRSSKRDSNCMGSIWVSNVETSCLETCFTTWNYALKSALLESLKMYYFTEGKMDVYTVCIKDPLFFEIKFKIIHLKSIRFFLWVTTFLQPGDLNVENQSHRLSVFKTDLSRNFGTFFGLSTNSYYPCKIFFISL